jgi:large subunit ribosomal protein L35
MAKLKKSNNKMKTHKGCAKVFKKRQSGSIKMTRQGINHNTGKNSAKRSRQKRKGSELNHSDYKRIKDLI